MGPQVPQLEVKRIADGLGFGEGTISAAEREAEAGNEDLATITDQAIVSPAILTPVDIDNNTGEMLDDDGCGDGRSVSQRIGAIFTKIAGKAKEFARSLHRPKVFGGGATMATATRIGLGLARDHTMAQAMVDGMDALGKRHINFGAHTDNHAHGNNCGCGAIDKAPLIVQAVRTYGSQIEHTIVNGLGVKRDGLSEVMGEFLAYGSSIQGQAYSGRQVMNEIVDRGKIVKELADDHKETRIILNMVKGFTVNQEYIRQQTGGRAHVFAVDVWRLMDLAQKLYDDPVQQQKAFLSELVYTLATAAVLTKGDLPVYMIAEANQYASIPA